MGYVKLVEHPNIGIPFGLPFNQPQKGTLKNKTHPDFRTGFSKRGLASLLADVTPFLYSQDASRAHLRALGGKKADLSQDQLPPNSTSGNQMGWMGTPWGPFAHQGKTDAILGVPNKLHMERCNFNSCGVQGQRLIFCTC